MLPEAGVWFEYAATCGGQDGGRVTSVAVIAIQQIRRMRGGAQSHLMLAADGNLYVVKFRNNPQHVRVLAKEVLATRLAEAIGLSVPGPEGLGAGAGWSRIRESQNMGW